MTMGSAPGRIQAMIKKNRRLVAGSAVIFALSALLVIEALHGRHIARKAEIAARAEAYVSGPEASLRGPQAERRIQSAEERITEMEKGLLGAGNPAVGAALLQEAFKSFASKKGISVASERALPASENGGYRKVPVEFQFKANLEELKGLLDDVSASKTVMGVRSVRVKSPDSGAGRLDVSLVLEGAIRR